MQIIKDQKIIDDTFTHVDDGAALPDGPSIVSWSRWQAERDALSRSGKPLGVRVASDADADEIGADLAHFAVVAIEFPAFTDGRGYSIARVLRDRFGFGGEIRAVGNVLRDQMFYMHRCGFDAYELTEGKSLEGALEAFNDFTVTYQPDANEAQPLFRRG